MLDSTLTFGPVTVQTMTLLLALAIAATAGSALRRSERRGALADVMLGGLAGAVLLSRALHVLLNWAYFAYNTDEITRLHAGGLDWHGALVGALLGMVLAGRWRRVSVTALLDTLSPGLPLLALAAWGGCWAANCAYGAEVATLTAYPDPMAWEGPDIFGIYAPRFHTQLLGAGVATGLLLLAGLLAWRGWLRGRRFWLLLALLAASMFVLGFLRGDYAVAARGLRLDQWLDALVAALAGTLTVIPPGH